jgi:hypothetical protein
MTTVSRVDIVEGVSSARHSMAGELLAIHIRSGALYDAMMAVLAHVEAVAARGDLDTAVEELLAVQAHPAVGVLRKEAGYRQGCPQPFREPSLRC